MRLDKLTVKSREALSDADSLARRLGHQGVTSLHMLCSLQNWGQSPTQTKRSLLRKMKQTPNDALVPVHADAKPLA